MKTNILIRTSLFALLLAQSGNMTAQFQVSGYNEAGWNNVSDGLYIKEASMVQYQPGKYNAGAGIQFDLKSNSRNVISGYNLRFSRNCLIKKLHLEVQSFLILTPVSHILRETNWGLLLSIKRNHIAASAGTNFRTLAFTGEIFKNSEFDTRVKIHENWNLMYAFSYYLKPVDNPWNLSLSITDIDNFIITQESNPVINLQASYQISSSLNLFAESWYKSAGALNLQNNFFGYFFRTGIIWKIN